MTWPSTASALVAEQERLGAGAHPEPFGYRDGMSVGGCFACFDDRDRVFAAAALVAGGRLVATADAQGTVSGDYQAGLLALREGPVLEAAVRALPRRPDVLIVNATGRDHPRRAGLALHLGAVLEVATVGVTHRPLVATGTFGAGLRGATWPVRLGAEVVGAWVVTRPGTRPVVAHAAWRTSVDEAARVVVLAATRARTPEPVRQARRVARCARGGATG